MAAPIVFLEVRPQVLLRKNVFLSLLDDKLIMRLLFHFHLLCQYFIHLGKPLKSTGGANLSDTLPPFQLIVVGGHWRQLGQILRNVVQRAPGKSTAMHKASAWHSMGGQTTQSPSVSETMWHNYGTDAVQNQPLYVNYICLVPLLELNQ